MELCRFSTALAKLYALSVQKRSAGFIAFLGIGAVKLYNVVSFFSTVEWAWNSRSNVKDLVRLVSPVTSDLLVMVFALLGILAFWPFARSRETALSFPARTLNR